MVGKTSRKNPYRASSAEGLRRLLLKSLGNRAFWNAYRHMELPERRHVAGIDQPGGVK
jgi:hypothetical protein